jgi:Ca-activated chloride channel family protein
MDDMKTGTLKQILLITDGCSNQGENPVAMAALANEEGITVNVIGVLQNDELDSAAEREIENIAKAGNGISQVVVSKQLSQTVQMVTRKAMTQTLHGMMNKELRSILGPGNNIESLPPDKRMEVVEVVDDYSEKVDLEMIILVDASGSMQDKITTVKESLIDLSISLNSRIGNNSYSVLVFPGIKNDAEKILDWTGKFNNLSSIFPKLSLGGMTPTGPAIKEAVNMFKEKRNELRGYVRDEDSFYRDSSF